MKEMINNGAAMKKAQTRKMIKMIFSELKAFQNSGPLFIV